MPFHLIFPLGIFSLFSDKIATGSFDQTAKIWNTSDGSLLHTLKSHTAEIVCLSFDPTSQNLVTGSMDKTAILWNVENGQPIMQIDVF